MAAAARPGLARGFAAALSELEARGVSRKDVAAELGVDPSTIGRYASGERNVPIESLPVIDRMAGQSLGYVLRLSGYVADIEVVDVIGAIEVDPNLTASGRKVVRAFYEFEASRNRAASDDTNPDADESDTRKSVIR